MNEKNQLPDNRRHHRARMRVSAAPFYALLAMVGIAMVLIVADPSVRNADAAGKPVVVTMKDEPPAFIPKDIKVKVGTTVTWKNTGATIHDVTTDASLAQNKADVSLPPGAKSFDSGFMTPGGSWSYTFTVPGHYKYACIPHEKGGMVGEVTVTK